MKIVIVGAGGHGRVVLDILRNNHQFSIAGFIDSDPAKHHQEMDGIPILGDLSLVPQFRDMGIEGAIVAIGDNRIRDTFAGTLEQAGIGLVSAIHPSANIAGNAAIGKNCVLCAGANICTHVIIEDSVILNTGCIVDHESRIEKAAHICPGVRLAGHVRVCEFATVGIGSTIIQNLKIGPSAMVGAGSVVIEHVPAYSTVVGVPAKVIKKSHVQPLHPEPEPMLDISTASKLITRPIRVKPAEAIPLQFVQTP